jgi:hypothetical protein
MHAFVKLHDIAIELYTKTSGSFAISTSSNQVHEDRCLLPKFLIEKSSIGKHIGNSCVQTLVSCGTSRDLDDKLEMLKKYKGSRST